jgi:hypothetical protein
MMDTDNESLLDRHLKYLNLPFTIHQQKESPMLKAYGYIRVSSKGQIDGDGFKRQKKSSVTTPSRRTLT